MHQSIKPAYVLRERKGWQRPITHSQAYIPRKHKVIQKVYLPTNPKTALGKGPPSQLSAGEWLCGCHAKFISVRPISRTTQDRRASIAGYYDYFGLGSSRLRIGKTERDLLFRSVMAIHLVNQTKNSSRPTDKSACSSSMLSSPPHLRHEKNNVKRNTHWNVSGRGARLPTHLLFDSRIM